MRTVNSSVGTGRVVLVSGATGGIGGAIVSEMARAGDLVVMLGRDRDRLERRRAELAAQVGGDCSLATQQTDINVAESVDRAVAGVVERFGRLDAVVHAAGDGPVAPLAETTDDMWHTTFNSKLMGAVRLVRAAAGPMAARGRGSIVLVNGAFRSVPDPLFPVNSAINAGLAAFAKAVSRDLGRSGVRVNVVDPGAVDTALWAQTAKELGERTGGTADDVNAQVVAQTPLGALTSPVDIAHLVRFLLSPEAAHLTGAAITIDGGACPAL
jgi:3-oxoacyl-[acyl-carrier protein] reductase